MTTLGSLLKPVYGTPQPLNLARVTADISAAISHHNLTASIAGPGASPTTPVDLGGPTAVMASILAWTNQDDDAHEPCSLTACRSPLHPGPCKGWKGILHSVSPATYQKLENERVQKANTRRVKRIADLKSQGKPIPRHLLDEIKPKPAPIHNAHSAQPVPLGQVNQKADLAGGQAHTAGQAVSKAAGVTVKTAPPLPLGPKAKKPTVAGRGPAFVITQPKVTDTYKLDKAAKITPQEWDDLTPHDKATIRNELTAIKARGFGPQQTKADALLAKLPAANTVGNTTPSGQVRHVVGKVTLGQATKTVSAPASKTPQLPAPPPSPKRGSRDQNGILNKPLPGGSSSSTSVGLPSGYRISRDGMGYSLKHNGKLIRTSATQKALEDYAKEHHAKNAPAAPGAAPTTAQAAPASSPGIKPSAPLAPGTAAHVQHANAVANRTAPKATMGKTHIDAYGKLTKADFDALPADQQKTIRDDLANARAKFLDPKKQQAAKDLLDRFGSRHPAASMDQAAATPGAKGYSDPQSEAVRAASSGLVSNDDVVKTAGRLSPDSVKGLTGEDRKKVLGRLAFVATDPKADPVLKAKATAIGRMINSGSPALTSRKWDHTPTFSELHTEENAPAARALMPAAELAKLPRAERVKVLTALTKAQFDGLKPDEQRKITDALSFLHTDRQVGGISQRDPDVEQALIAYTGQRPAIHRIRQAESDFRRGAIDADKLWSEFLHARVQEPSKMNGPASPLAKEAERVAADNPKLPLWLRASLIENPYSGYNNTYNSIAKAQNKYNWEDAPRLSSADINDIFDATVDELAKSDPIHAQAVKELREHVLRTGLRGQPGVPSGSPWSLSTRNYVVDSLLHIHGGTTTVPAEQLKEFKALPPDLQITVERILRDQITAQTNNHAKTTRWLQANQLGGRRSIDLNPAQDAAVRQATDRVMTPDLDLYRKLDPSVDFDPLPRFVRDAIDTHLDEAQSWAGRAGPILTWTGTENPLKVFPGALKDHLNGMRTVYAQWRTRQASDIANFGTKIINPLDRTKVYGDVPIPQFQGMSQGDQDLITADLDKIAHDPTHNLVLRWDAQYAKDVKLGDAIGKLNMSQLIAIGHSEPRSGNARPDADTTAALVALDKADFDKLDKVYREAIDQRIGSLNDAGQQQLLNAKFHPAAAAATPAGFTPTAGTPAAPLPPHVQDAIDTIYGVHKSGKSHTMAHQLSVYGALRGSDFGQLNGQEQGHLLGDLSFIATTAKGPSADKARKLIDRFTPAGTPAGQVPTGAVIPPVNAVAGQVRYATPLKGLEKAKDSGQSGDGWISLPGGGRVWGAHGAAGLMLQHVDPQTGEKRYLMVQRGPAISDPGKWTFPGGAIDSKETPHQGAARETIEELGLKDDVLKDALVHGDHTFTVPGSTWKYTTVAAQVPTMIKPNLATAHARAETSDAKWMTEAEIKALDTAGKLHHPIAGGKLETNVLSLYPQAPSPTSLGQIVRPSAVTKRQDRLRLPVNGRQAPTASPNAWTAPHKQSKGRNLISDKATIDKLRQDVKQARKQYDGKTADGRLAAIGNMQGFDDTPTVVPKKEIDRLLATGDYIEVWRGVKGANRWSGSGKTAAQINEEMRSGPAYYGKGIFGNGFYLATQKSVAQQYADNTKNSIARILIPKSAITEHYNKVEKEAHAASSRTSKAKGGRYEEGTLYDPGRYAAAKGIDGIEIQHHHTSSGGWAKHVAKPNQPAFNWLNRSVLIIQEAQ